LKIDKVEKISEKAFENCIKLKNVSALSLNEAEIDSFLNCFCVLETKFEGDLADV
jgi:hypothetical protein